MAKNQDFRVLLSLLSLVLSLYFSLQLIINQSFTHLVIAVIAKINKNIRIRLKSQGPPILTHRGTPPCESEK